MNSMQHFRDNEAISELVQKWMCRDLGEWDSMRDLFHPEGTIEVTWFEGRFQDFLEASMKMRSSNLRSKHLIGVPIIRFNADRAIAETNAVIVLENAEIELGCDAHARLFDLVERRDGAWKILRRYCFYDMAKFAFPFGLVDIDRDRVKTYPLEYAALAYILGRSGFALKRVMPTRGSEAETNIRTMADRWLEGC